MELINDLEADLAYAFLVERRYRQKIDSEEALALIGRVKTVLESNAGGTADRTESSQDNKNSLAAY